MNKLLILALIVLISIIIYFCFNEIEKEGMGNELDFIQKEAEREIIHNKFNEIKVAMNSPMCTLGECDLIDIKKKKVLKKDENGYAIEEVDIYKPYNEFDTNEIKYNKDKIQVVLPEGFTGERNSLPIENQLKYCKKETIDCENMGKNCGFCDDDYLPPGEDPTKVRIGRFMWTKDGTKGSGMINYLNRRIEPNGKSCPADKWVFGDINECKKRRLQRLCSLIKSCDDFEKYGDLVKDKCGYCPTLGKAVPIVNGNDGKADNVNAIKYYYICTIQCLKNS